MNAKLKELPLDKRMGFRDRHRPTGTPYLVRRAKDKAHA
jgi:hypothetical protein